MHQDIIPGELEVKIREVLEAEAKASGAGEAAPVDTQGEGYVRVRVRVRRHRPTSTAQQLRSGRTCRLTQVWRPREETGNGLLT